MDRSLVTALLAYATLSCVSAQRLAYKDINIVAVTDVHSWIGGGDRLEPPKSAALDATFGDLVSFTERARADAKLVGKDVFLVDNGDVIDGTGLSNAAENHCEYLLPLLRQVPFDALNCGNHELYSSSTMEAFNRTGYISSWSGRYLTSNLQNATNGLPLGALFRMLRGPVSGVQLLTFGFMYDMGINEGRTSAVDVVPVEQTVKSEWFQQALAQQGAKADAILILAHMDADEPLIRTIVTAIRAVWPHKPIQVIAGHSHMRKQNSIDGRAHVFEPGNYFNTVGFASFDLPKSSDTASAIQFGAADIDSSVSSIASSLGVLPSALPTNTGAAVGAAIRNEQAKLGLSNVLGCARTGYFARNLTKLYISDVVPSTLFAPAHNKSQWFIFSTGGLRYDLYQGNVTVDDIYKILPFRDTFLTVRNLNGKVLQGLFDKLNRQPPPLKMQNMVGLPASSFDAFYAATDPKPSSTALFDAFWVSFDSPFVTKALNEVTNSTHVPEAYTYLESDTQMMQKWASESLPRPPCHSPPEPPKKCDWASKDLACTSDATCTSWAAASCGTPQGVAAYCRTDNHHCKFTTK